MQVDRLGIGTYIEFINLVMKKMFLMTFFIVYEYLS